MIRSGESISPSVPKIGLVQSMGVTRKVSAWLDGPLGRGYLLISPAFFVAVLLLLLPVIALVALSFTTQNYFDIDFAPTLANYATVFQPSATPTYFLGVPFYLENPIYLILMVKSLLIAAIATAAVVLLAYPMAYFLAFGVTRHKFLWIVLITLPFWTSYLLRIFSWKVILGYDGVVNSTLKAFGAIASPLEFLLYSPTAVVITLAHSWAAFAILPIYVSLEKIDRSLFEASKDLGDTPLKRFLRITLPLSMPGVIAACLLVFIPTVGDYATPTLVGGREGIMIANIVQSQFGKANNAPLGAALSIISLVVVAVIVLLFVKTVGREQRVPKWR